MHHVPLPPAFLSTPIAHRAYHNRSLRRPENSRAAIRAAIAAGYGIEIDLQLSSDGHAMVFHDDDLYRLTSETGPICAQTAATLTAINLRDSDETIPTLPEILTLIAGRTPLLIEIKDQEHNGGPGIGPLEAATAKALATYQGPVAVMSFNPKAIAEMARLAPHIPRGLTTGSYDYEGYAPLPPALCDRLREIPDYAPTGSSFISHEWRDLARPRVTDLKTAGAAILCWTIKSPLDEATARKIAQNITFEQYPAPFPA
ncbi:MAG: glycerophosphodiester phosphodiesterase family protein [Paracoccaceae bacterium]